MFNIVENQNYCHYDDATFESPLGLSKKNSFWCFEASAAIIQRYLKLCYHRGGGLDSVCHGALRVTVTVERIMALHRWQHPAFLVEGGPWAPS